MKNTNGIPDGYQLVFDVRYQIECKILEICRWFADNCPKGPAVIGISGGKDSTVEAKLLVDALGKDRVFGVLMPDGEQSDIADSYEVVELLGIKHLVINIGEITSAVHKNVPIAFTPQANQNLPPRIRMATLYAVAQSLGGVVIGTGNISELYLGWFTKWGDGAYDNNFILCYTATEVMKLGDALGLPEHLVHKTPSDGLCGVSDEEKFGFSYQVLDDYIRGFAEPIEDIKQKIDQMHKNSEHKRR